MNRTATIVPIIGALVKAEDILGKHRTWQPTNQPQRQLITDYFSARQELNLFSAQELRSWIDTVANNLNKILREEGFVIKLRDFGKDEFGVVSILDVLVEWLVKGEVVTIDTLMMGNYTGVKLTNKNGESNFFGGRSPIHEYPIAAVRTRSDDTVYMTIADTRLADFELLDRIRKIESSLLSEPGYTSLTFPMIDLNETVDIGWLKALETVDENGKVWHISQVLQQTKFKMNEKGARAKSAVAMAMRSLGSSSQKYIVINRPFFLWIKRPGTTIPIFAACLDESVWKNPGNLDL